MADSIPGFSGGVAAAAPLSSTAGPTATTAVYQSSLGLAALTWSRSLFGLSLLVELRHLSSAADSSLSFNLRPSLLWKRRGKKRFPAQGVDFSWDLSRARFSSSPEPLSGFFVNARVNGETFFIAGDMEVAGKRPSRMVFRRDHVVFSGARVYFTKAIFGGMEREIAIDLGGERDSRMWVAVDGKRVVQVKKLRWKFRGTEKVEMEDKRKLQVSWDLHRWVFDEQGFSSFVFRFEEDEEGEKDGSLWRRLWWAESFGGAEAIGGKKKKLLVKTGSSSSSSSASSGSSSSVADWASAEENELQGSGGFSLLVCLWRS